MADRPRPHDGTSEAEQKIMAATERLLATVPVHQLSVEQILKEAGVSRRTFYVYFGSKFAVITRLAERVMGEIFNVIQPFLTTAEGESRREALRRSLEAGWDVWIEHRLVLRAVNEHWHEVPELREAWLDVFERFSEAMGAEIERERQAGLALPGPDGRQLASALLWSTAQCTYVAGLGADRALPDERAIFETVVSLWERAIYGAPAAPTR
jgi:TetR/AcrR family transcriptional regulator, ethionamide resistance regulator